MAGDVNIDLRLIVDQFEKKLGSVSSKVDTFSKKTDNQLSGISSKLQKSFGSLGSKIDTAIGTGLGIIGARAAFAFKNAMSQAVNEALSFNLALKEIETILPNNARLTKDNVDQLQQLSSLYGSSTTQQAKSFYQIVSAGVTDTTKATELLNAANQLSVGGLADLGGSIDILTTAVNTYGIETLSAEEAADSLFTTVRLGKTTAEQLASSLGQVLPAAKSLGVNLDTVNASVALLTTRGFSTSEAVTRLNSLFTALARKSELLGPGFDAAAVQADGLVEVFKRLQERTGGSQEELVKLFGRIEAVQGFNILGQNLEELTRNIDQFSNKAGAARKASSKIIDESVSKQFDILKNNITLVAQDLVSVFNPVLLETTKLINRAFGSTTTQKSIGDLKGEIDDLTRRLEYFNGRSNKELSGEFIVLTARLKETKAELQKLTNDEFLKTGGKDFIQLFDKSGQSIERSNAQLDIFTNKFADLSKVTGDFSGNILLRTNVQGSSTAEQDNAKQAELIARQREKIETDLQNKLTVIRETARLNEKVASIDFINSSNNLSQIALEQFKKIELEKILAARKTDQERINSIKNTSTRETEQLRFDADNAVKLEKIVSDKRAELLLDLSKRRSEERRKQAAEEQKEVENSLKRQQQLITDINLIKESQILEEQERTLNFITEKNELDEAEFLRFEEIERRKVEIATQSEQAKIDAIKNTSEQKLAQDKLDLQRQIELDKKLADQRKKNNDTISKNDSNFQKASLTATGNFLEAGAKLSKDGSDQQKAIRIAQATMDTYTAANKALSDPSIPAAIAPAVAASFIALGLANVARITSAGSFQDGGIIRGSSSVGDRLTANVNSNEMILNRNQQAELFNQANGGGSSIDRSDLVSIVNAIKDINIRLVANDNEIARSTSRGVSNGVIIGESE